MGDKQKMHLFAVGCSVLTHSPNKSLEQDKITSRAEISGWGLKSKKYLAFGPRDLLWRSNVVFLAASLINQSNFARPPSQRVAPESMLVLPNWLFGIKHNLFMVGPPPLSE